MIRLKLFLAPLILHADIESIELSKQAIESEQGAIESAGLSDIQKPEHEAQLVKSADSLAVLISRTRPAKAA